MRSPTSTDPPWPPSSRAGGDVGAGGARRRQGEREEHRRQRDASLPRAREGGASGRSVAFLSGVGCGAYMSEAQENRVFMSAKTPVESGVGLHVRGTGKSCVYEC
jgi:hypothetical protein